MEIGYRYFAEWTKEQQKILKRFGISIEIGADSIELIADKHPQNLFELIKNWENVEYSGVGTLYTKKEIDNADLLIYVANWTNGYPMKDDDNGYIELTYDTKKMCSECHSGLQQDAPFRLRRKPKWNKKNAFELEWIYGEIFVKKEIYELVFEPIGIDHWNVLHYKNDSLIEDTVQLKLPISDVALNLENQLFEVCNKCGVKRYVNQIEGYFPNFINQLKPKFPICNSQEWYGCGWQMDRWIIITQELRQKMIKFGINPKCEPIKKPNL